MTVALYPGSFDPVTNGHLDIVRRALAVFDRVVVAVLANPRKQPLLDAEIRVATLEQDPSFPPGATVREAVVSADPELADLERGMREIHEELEHAKADDSAKLPSRDGRAVSVSTAPCWRTCTVRVGWDA